MVESTFKTMYLVSKSDLDNNATNNFKLSLQNKDICDGGMNVSVKPIKTRLRNKTQINKKSELYLDNSRENEDGNNHAMPEQEYRYSRPTVQSVGTNTINQRYEKDDEREVEDPWFHIIVCSFIFKFHRTPVEQSVDEEEDDETSLNDGDHIGDDS